MAHDEFDPVKAGHEEAAKNSKGVAKAVAAEEASFNSNVEDAQKLAKKNAKLDDTRRGEATMKPQDVGTAERDIPEGAPVTSDPEVASHYKPGGPADSKDADVKKDLPDDKKRQDTSKDSATPSDETTEDKALEENPKKADTKTTNGNQKDGK